MARRKDNEGAATVAPDDQAQAPALVPMVRDGFPPADVHPSEVENYRAAGWREA